MTVYRVARHLNFGSGIYAIVLRIGCVVVNNVVSDHHSTVRSQIRPIGI